VPVVITLHDEWLLTGRCAASWDCERWRAGCGACPDLARPPVADRDATAFNWWRKARIYEKSRLYVIAPSQRILDQACQSMLTPAIADARVIPNGVDLTLFSPGDPALSRNLLPEPARNAVRQPQGLVMVTVTSAGGDNPYKDWPCLRRALEMLPWQSADGPLHLIVVGGKVAQEQVGSVSVHHVGYLRHAELVHCYRAADLFVHATKAETFGLAVVEAMACGLPVVVTDVGATAEVTGGGRAGCLTPVGDASAMARALSRFLTDADLRRSRGEESLRLARERSCREAMADAHLSYYNEITSGWRMTTGA
jgi:glycosyltransferase involved in cell wall biosynthesis